MSGEDVFRRLQQHIDNMPVGFPATESGVEIRLLKYLFTPEEAAMALHLSALPEPLETIQTRAQKDGVDPQELRKGLNRMVRKGAIHKTRRDGKPHFSKAMLAVGMFEFQVNRLTREYHADLLQYMDEGFAEAFHTKGTSQLRTIPIGEEVLPERPIGTYDGARALVGGSEGPFAVLNCVCRQGMDLLEDPCKQTDIRETCLVMGSWASSVLRGQGGREVTREEMLAFLDRADEVGMVLQPQNTQDPGFICCCCGCCCGVLSTAKKLPRPAEYFDANYFAQVDADLCVECGTCQDRCEMEAISMEGDGASVDLLRCIGCGLCVSACPDEAIEMVAKPDAKDPPRTQGDLYKTIMMERFGPMGMAKVVAKKTLGMKI